MFEGKRVLVTGATGSLGKRLVRHLLAGAAGRPQEVIAFSRDEAKQHTMRLDLERRGTEEDDAVHDHRDLVRFHLGDIGDYDAVCKVVRRADVIVNAAAMKQVPTCEFFPSEAVRTNILGPEQLVRAIRRHDYPVEVVVGISTDKACKPVNVMGMTKALQERLLVQANLEAPGTRFVIARYGNVIGSRGSVIPLFLDQIENGGPVTVTAPEMTRFMMTLDQAVQTVVDAAASARPGETYVPSVPSAFVTDIAAALIGQRPIDTTFTGIRPGEKVHEILVAEEERPRTVRR
ncbi:MAG: polysaccharide biosynthesis protein, partial [Ilumatobacter sp.]|nr:polysaccharide biosynthesis protein [Ilumatobacter sp.]